MTARNWDKSKREVQRAKAYDYSAAMDAIESGVVFGRDEAAWDRLERRRQGAAGRPGWAASGANIAGRQRGKLTKGQQRERDARALGISVGELKARRQAEGAEIAALSAEARRRGITVKKLRKLIAAGQAPRPRPDERAAGSTGGSTTGNRAKTTPVVSRTRRALSGGRT